jgi:hypothetical protein
MLPWDFFSARMMWRCLSLRIFLVPNPYETNLCCYAPAREESVGSRNGVSFPPHPKGERERGAKWGFISV